MTHERRTRFRAGDRWELEELLTVACAEAFAAQAREDRVRRELLATAARDEDPGSAGVRALLSELGDAGAQLAMLRARIARVRAELGRVMPAAPTGPAGRGAP